MEPLFDEKFMVTALGDNLIRRCGPPAAFHGVSVDSRTSVGGDLFVAISGERYDGHSFVADAVSRGAEGILCRSDFVATDADGKTIFQVRDCLEALKSLAKARRKETLCPVIAVAGSVGKTTTKEMIAALLRGRYTNVMATRRSENGDLGIPLTILRWSRNTDIAVVEIGIDRPGAMDDHLALVQPTLGVVTAIAPEHLETLRDIETVAFEENQCLKWLAKTGASLAINLDDQQIWPLDAAKGAASGRCVGFTVDIRANGGDEILTGKIDGSILSLNGLGLRGAQLDLPLPGDHNARNLLASVAVARMVGLSADEMKTGLKTFTGPEGRSEIRRMGRGSVAVCDYYNASPASMRAAFKLAASLVDPSRHRLVACLGDMLELGPDEEDLHRALADDLIDLGFAAVWCAGTRMRWLNDELKRRRYSGSVCHFTDVESLALAVAVKIGADDIILIKGSRGMAMERVWAFVESVND